MTSKDKISLAQNIAVISGIFCVAVALLLMLNYWQLTQSDPIESKALEALVERLGREPDNEELKTEIRNFDLLARKAYFNSRWQVKTGAYLLLFGCIILGVALHIYYALKAKIEEPEKISENEIASRILAQKGVIIVGAVIFLLALVASFFSVDHLEHYALQTVSADVADSEPTDEGIEVIDVSKPSGVTDTGQLENEIVGLQKDVAEESTGKQSEETTVHAVDTEQEPDDKTGPSGDSDPSDQAAMTMEQVRQNHNSFRGPLAQGVTYHGNIPVKWDGPSGESVLWKTSVPKHGYNSPVIWGEKIFLAGAGEINCEVYCFNRYNGELLWTGRADNIPGSPSSPPKVTEDTGLSAPSVTTDGKSVFAIFATGDVIAFTVDGERVWAKNLGVPDNHYGHSSSLITWDNKLFIQYDTNTGGKVVALDVFTGNTIWETAREVKISWSSPVLAEIDGEMQLILTSDPIVAGYDIQTGEELWAVDCMMGEVGPSVGFSDGIVYAANEYARLVAIDIKTHEILWEDDYYLPEASSPLAHNGLLVIATSYGVIVCYDAKTGEKYWEHDIGTTLYSSPMFADNKLFIMDNEGVMRVYEFSKELNLISENKLGEIAGTTPAFAEGRIYMRGQEHLFCIGD